MKVILDTNVVISAVYFGGAPLRILKAWRDGLLELVVTDDILNGGFGGQTLVIQSE